MDWHSLCLDLLKQMEDIMKVKTEVKAGLCDFDDFDELDLEDLLNGGDGCGRRAA